MIIQIMKNTELKRILRENKIKLQDYIGKIEKIVLNKKMDKRK